MLAAVAAAASLVFFLSPLRDLGATGGGVFYLALMVHCAVWFVHGEQVHEWPVYAVHALGTALAAAYTAVHYSRLGGAARDAYRTSVTGAVCLVAAVFVLLRAAHADGETNVAVTGTLGCATAVLVHAAPPPGGTQAAAGIAHAAAWALWGAVQGDFWLAGVFAAGGAAAMVQAGRAWWERRRGGDGPDGAGRRRRVVYVVRKAAEEEGEGV